MLIRGNACKQLLCSATTKGNHALPIKTLYGDFPTHFLSQPECSMKHVAAPVPHLLLLIYCYNQFITSSYLFV